MNRLQVNKDVFKALGEAINVFGADQTMNMHSQDPMGWNGASEPLNSLSIPEMARALYVGHELKPTPEEAILGFYKAHERMANSRDYDTAPEGKAVCGAINFVLNHLEIKIEGINK